MTSAGCTNIAMLTVDTDCGCGRNTECNYELLQRTFDMFAVNIVMTATQTGPRNWASGPDHGQEAGCWAGESSCHAVMLAGLCCSLHDRNKKLWTRLCSGRHIGNDWHWPS